MEDATDAVKVADELGEVKYLEEGFEHIDEVKHIDEIVDPPGTFRDPNGRLRNTNGTFSKDPKTIKFNRSMSERKKALLRDALDPDSGLSNRARKQILDSNGKKVPKGYEVDHIEPLYTAKTKMGKKELDIAENMKTMPKSDHRKLHKKCNKVKYHKYPPNKY